MTVWLVSIVFPFVRVAQFSAPRSTSIVINTKKIKLLSESMELIWHFLNRIKTDGQKDVSQRKQIRP